MHLPRNSTQVIIRLPQRGGLQRVPWHDFVDSLQEQFLKGFCPKEPWWLGWLKISWDGNLWWSWYGEDPQVITMVTVINMALTWLYHLHSSTYWSYCKKYGPSNEGRLVHANMLPLSGATCVQSQLVGRMSGLAWTVANTRSQEVLPPCLLDTGFLASPSSWHEWVLLHSVSKFRRKQRVPKAQKAAFNGFHLRLGCVFVIHVVSCHGWSRSCHMGSEICLVRSQDNIGNCYWRPTIIPLPIFLIFCLRRLGVGVWVFAKKLCVSNRVAPRL